MSKLGQLLSYLERPDVTELVFRSGAPAVMRVGQRLHPITSSPLRTTQIRRIFDGTPLVRLLPTRGEVASQTHTLDLQGRSYRLIVRGRGAVLELRMSRASDPVVESSPPDRAGRGPDVPRRRPVPTPARTSAGDARGQDEASRGPDSPATPRRVPSPAPRPSPLARRRPVESTERAPMSRPSADRIGPSRIRERTPPGQATNPEATHEPPRGGDHGVRSTERLGAQRHDPAEDPATPRVSTVANPRAMPSLSRDSESSDASLVPDEPGTFRPSTAMNPAVMPSLSRDSESSDASLVPDEPGTFRPSTAMNQSVMPLLTRDRYDEPATPSAVLDEPGSYRPPTAPNPAAMPSLTRSDPHQSPAPAEPEPAATYRVRARAGSPVHERLRQLLVAARQHGASDVHVMADGPVRIRRLGALQPRGEPIPKHEVEAMVEPLLQPRHAEQLDTLGYADLGVQVDGAGRLRVNVSRQRTGLKICVRLVATEPPALESLGLPSEVRRITAHHQGMVLVAGPSGQGKTTSMSAMVDLFNAEKSVHIITIEDPVEVIHPRKKALVTQRELGSHTLSFPAALAAALREDPDVIAIGELRDRETVEMALAAAETGHLVLATMSTPSGAKTIDRVIDMFPPDDQSQVRATLAGALKLVISQRLVQRADGLAQVAAYEMITGNVPLWSLIRDDKLYQLPSLLQRGRNFGMIRLEDSLRALMTDGVITEQEARRHADDPRALAPTPAPTPDPPPSGRRFGRRR